MRATSRAASLALIAGSADAAGWVIGGIFTAHMTGNTVLVGVSLARGDWRGAALRAATIVASFAGFCLGAALLRRGTAARHRALGLLAGTGALVAAFAGNGPYDIMLLAAALAMQNVAYREFGGTKVNIGFLTGDLQSLAATLFGRQGDWAAARLIPVVWLAYVAGGAATALIAHEVAHPLLPASLGLLAFALVPAEGRAPAPDPERS